MIMNEKLRTAGFLFIIFSLVFVLSACDLGSDDTKAAVAVIESFDIDEFGVFSLTVSHGTTAEEVLDKLQEQYDRVTANLDDESQIEVEVDWNAPDTYNGEEPGVYEFIGHVDHEMNEENLNLYINVTVLEEEIEELVITGVEALADIIVDYGTEFADIGLPVSVDVTLDDESSRTLDVDWQAGDYDGKEAGSYDLSGDLINLPIDVVNEDDLKAEITVIVNDPLVITGVETLADIMVEHGTEFADIGLPVSVEVTLDDGNSRTLDVDWQGENYDGEETGSYDLSGDLINLPIDVVNEDDLKAAVTVIVGEEVIGSFKYIEQTKEDQWLNVFKIEGYIDVFNDNIRYLHLESDSFSDNSVIPISTIDMESTSSWYSITDSRVILPELAVKIDAEAIIIQTRDENDDLIGTFIIDISDIPENMSE